MSLAGLRACLERAQVRSVCCFLARHAGYPPNSATQELATTTEIVPAVLSMLPLASEAVLDAVIEEVFQAAVNAPQALQHELADACHHLAEVDRQECFVAIAFKGWYYVSVGGRTSVLPENASSSVTCRTCLEAASAGTGRMPALLRQKLPHRVM